MKRPFLLIAVIVASFLKYTALAQNIYTFAGIAGAGGYAGDGGLATVANLNGPTGIATDISGNLYIADTRNNVVRTVSTAGVISTFAGTAGGFGGYSGDGGAATSAQLNSPSDVAIDAAGNVYIADSRNDVIRVVNALGIISTYAGTGAPGAYSGDGGLANAAQLNRPSAIAVDASGNVYISDTRNNVIREVIASTGIINTIAGNNAAGPGFAGDGGPATAASLNNPEGIVLDAVGNLYIADSRNNVVRIVNIGSGNINTFAGNNAAGPGYTGDGGMASAAQLNDPYDVKVDASGNIFIADHSNTVRKVNTGDTISTFAGNGIAGYSGDGGLATLAEMSGPEGIAIDTAHNVYISSTNNNVIRRIGAAVTGVSITSNTGDTVCFNTLISFTATPISDTASPHYTWLQNGVAAGTDSAIFTPSTFATGDVINCILLNSGGDTLAVSGTLRIDSLPNAGTILGPATFCTGSFAIIRDFTGGPGGTGGIWSVTDSSIAALSVATGGPGGGGPGGEVVTALTAGADTIYYVTTNICGTDSASLIITVGVNTLGHISGPDSVCAGSTVTYTDTPAGGFWTVMPPFGNTIDSLTGTFTAGIPGGGPPRPVVISYGTPGCSVSDTLSIVPLPMIAMITGVSSVDSGVTTTFTDPAPGGIWSSSNNTVATVDPVTGAVYGASIGTATISYSITGPAGCTVDTTAQITVISLAGVAIIANTSSFAVFPNPAMGSLNITWSGHVSGNGTVTISDVSGKTVYTSLIDMDTNDHARLDISSLQAGVYVISVQTGATYYYHKIVAGE